MKNLFSFLFVKVENTFKKKKIKMASEPETKNLEVAKKKQKIIRISLIVVGVVLGVVIIFLFIYFFVIRKQSSRRTSFPGFSSLVRSSSGSTSTSSSTFVPPVDVNCNTFPGNIFSMNALVPISTTGTDPTPITTLFFQKWVFSNTDPIYSINIQRGNILTNYNGTDYVFDEATQTAFFNQFVFSGLVTDDFTLRANPNNTFTLTSTSPTIGNIVFGPDPIIVCDPVVAGPVLSLPWWFNQTCGGGNIEQNFASWIEDVTFRTSFTYYQQPGNPYGFQLINNTPNVSWTLRFGLYIPLSDSYSPIGSPTYALTNRTIITPQQITFDGIYSLTGENVIVIFTLLDPSGIVSCEAYNPTTNVRFQKQFFNPLRIIGSVDINSNIGTCNFLETCLCDDMRNIPIDNLIWDVTAVQTVPPSLLNNPPVKFEIIPDPLFPGDPTRKWFKYTLRDGTILTAPNVVDNPSTGPQQLGFSDSLTPNTVTFIAPGLSPSGQVFTVFSLVLNYVFDIVISPNQENLPTCISPCPP